MPATSHERSAAPEWPVARSVRNGGPVACRHTLHARVLQTKLFAEKGNLLLELVGSRFPAVARANGQAPRMAEGKLRQRDYMKNGFLDGSRPMRGKVRRIGDGIGSRLKGGGHGRSARRMGQPNGPVLCPNHRLVSGLPRSLVRGAPHSGCERDRSRWFEERPVPGPSVTPPFRHPSKATLQPVNSATA